MPETALSVTTKKTEREALYLYLTSREFGNVTMRGTKQEKRDTNAVPETSARTSAA